MNEKTYNGWTNYETWAVALWLDNEEGSSNYWRERAEEAVEECRDTPSANARLTGVEPFTIQERAAFRIAEELKENHEEANPIEGASVFADLMNAALSDVNWYEIALHYVNEVEIEEETTLGEEKEL